MKGRTVGRRNDGKQDTIDRNKNAGDMNEERGEITNKKE